MFVFKPRRRVHGKAVASVQYSGRFRLAGELRWRTVPLQVTDKDVARRKLAEHVRALERIEAGLDAPRPLTEAALRPLAEHLGEYLDDVSAKGRSKDYVYNLKARNLRLFKECGWRTVRDATGESFIKWRSANAGKAPKTLNEFLDAARSFLGWMNRVGRIPGNPLRSVGKVETRGRERRSRRAFTLAELKRLFEVAGPRRAAYVVASYTGLRRNELANLLVADVRLSEPVPFLMVRASTTKNRKSARIELHPDALAVLQALIPEGAQNHRRVFQRLPTVEELKADEAAAGIPFVDDCGRRADFHAFRHTFTTMLAQAGVSPQVAKELTRHSDLRLNGHYTDATKLPLANVVRSLPSAVGGDNAHLCAQESGLEGHSEAFPVASSLAVVCGMGAVKVPGNQVETPGNGPAPTALLLPGPLVAGLGFEPRTFRL